MVKINKTKKRLPIVIIIAAAAVLLGVGGIVFAYRGTLFSAQTQEPPSSRPQDPENDVNYDPPTQQEKEESERQKEEIIENAENPPAASDTISAVIIRAEQRTKGGPLSVRALVNGTSSGTCVVTLYRTNSESVVKEFPVSFEATTSSCGSADIPVEGIDKGTWNVSLVVKSGNLTSQAQTTQVGIDK